MVRWFGSTVRIFAGCVCVFCGELLAQTSAGVDRESNGDIDVVNVDSKLVFSDQDRGLFRKDLQLGHFLPGKVIQCNLQLENHSERSFDFTRIEAGCSCLSVSPTQGRLAPGDKMKMVWRIRTPQNPSKAEQSVSIIAHDGRVFRFSIRAQYSASGVVGFKSASVRVRVPEGTENQHVELPIFADKLVQEELVDVDVSKSLEGITTALDYQRRLVNVIVPRAVVESGRVSGEIRIRNIETGSTDAVVLDLDVQAAISLFPSLLRFSSNEDDDRLVARLMVFDRNHQPSASTPTAGEFYLEDKKLETKLVRHAGAVSHFEISMQSEEKPIESDQDSTIRCVLIGKKSRQTLNVPFILQSSALSLSSEVE